MDKVGDRDLLCRRALSLSERPHSSKYGQSPERSSRFIINNFTYRTEFQARCVVAPSRCADCSPERLRGVRGIKMPQGEVDGLMVEVPL